MARRKQGPSKGRAGGGEIAVDLGGPNKNGVHPGSRDSGYRGKVHWDSGTAGEAYLIRPPGGTRVKLEFCKELPVSGEFDIETQGGAGVKREP